VNATDKEPVILAGAVGAKFNVTMQLLPDARELGQAWDEVTPVPVTVTTGVVKAVFPVFSTEILRVPVVFTGTAPKLMLLELNEKVLTASPLPFRDTGTVLPVIEDVFTFKVAVLAPGDAGAKVTVTAQPSPGAIVATQVDDTL
jgi:hypothetical protein